LKIDKMSKVYWKFRDLSTTELDETIIREETAKENGYKTHFNWITSNICIREGYYCYELSPFASKAHDWSSDSRWQFNNVFLVELPRIKRLSYLNSFVMRINPSPYNGLFLSVLLSWEYLEKIAMNDY
jgi:hypothetical protein